MDEIKIVGARIHNLKDINVNIPKGKMILIMKAWPLRGQNVAD